MILTNRNDFSDKDSPRAHRTLEYRSWTDFLKHRWPTALALVQAAAAVAVIVLLGADVEFAPGIATMAGIYLVAYALGRPAAAWAAYPSLGAVVLALIAVGIDAQFGMTVVLVLLWIWAVSRGRAHDGRWFTVQTAGMAVFGALTVLAALVDPKVGGLVAGTGWIAHGIWDIYHFAENKIVNRPWSEMCAVVDIPVGVALVVATLVR
jgi:hypothetical protein